MFVVRARGQASHFPDTGSLWLDHLFRPLEDYQHEAGRRMGGCALSDGWRRCDVGQIGIGRRIPGFTDVCGATGMTAMVGDRSAATNCTAGRYQDWSIDASIVGGSLRCDPVPT